MVAVCFSKKYDNELQDSKHETSVYLFATQINFTFM